MALGNNLKRIKKDSLIPIKKKEKAKDKKKAKAKFALKEKTKVKTKVKKIVKAKVAAVKIKASAKPKVAPAKAKEKKVETVAKPKPTIIKKTAIETKLTIAANLEERFLLGGEDGSTLTVKLIPSRRKTVRKTKMIFEGSLSLLEADAIKSCLLTTFSEYDLIDIQLQNISHLDLIPIQLIKAFISFYPDKKVKVDSELPFDIKIIAERAGFGSLLFNEDVA